MDKTTENLGDILCGARQRAGALFCGGLSSGSAWARSAAKAVDSDPLKKR
jgi:hypothetical protein